MPLFHHTSAQVTTVVHSVPLKATVVLGDCSSAACLLGFHCLTVHRFVGCLLPAVAWTATLGAKLTCMMCMIRNTLCSFRANTTCALLMIESLSAKDIMLVLSCFHNRFNACVLSCCLLVPSAVCCAVAGAFYRLRAAQCSRCSCMAFSLGLYSAWQADADHQVASCSCLLANRFAMMQRSPQMSSISGPANGRLDIC